MENRYAWQSRKQEEDYVAIARGFETRDAMQAYYCFLADAKDPNAEYRRRLRRVKKASK